MTTMNPAQPPERRSTFRQAETQAVLRAWSAGQSVSIVGVGSAGKSNFLQHLTTTGTVPGDILPVLIDANLLGPLPKQGDPARGPLAFWAGCELILHRIFMALYPFESMSSSEQTTLYQAYEALQDGTNPLYTMLALRYLELGLDVPLRHGLRIAFLFDEFERFAVLLPAGFFQALRGLRDLHKRQITFTTASRGLLTSVMEDAGADLLDVEPFTELFVDRVIYLSAYTRADAEAMAGDLLVRYGAVMGADTISALIDYTGGHPGLLRAALNAFIERPVLASTPAAMHPPALLALEGVAQECSAIWSSLSENEQQALLARQAGDCAAGAGDAELLLQRKRLLSENGVAIPPVFAAFAALSAAR